VTRLETVTWAAGLLGATKRLTVFGTVRQVLGRHLRIPAAEERVDHSTVTAVLNPFRVPLNNGVPRWNT
jgi:hypothetical protein